jgi:signal transduction histidine kinase
MSRELRPPGLDALGLVDAVRQQLATIGGPDGPTVTIDAGDVGVLPPAIEVAAYRIVVEAATNVVRHAGAQACVVRIAREPGALRIEVTDDGGGIRAGRVGVGTRAMYERAAEVGGELLVGPGKDAGTIVTAWLPLAATATPPVPSAPGEDRPRSADTVESAAGS